MIAALTDHLWQSTVFAAGAGALTLLLRPNSAGARYGLWFAASLKFLLPFAVLTAAAGGIAAHLHTAAAPPQLAAVQQFIAPFSPTQLGAATVVARPAASFDPVPALLFAWAVGFAAVLAIGAVRWSRVRTAVRASSPSPSSLLTPSPIPLRCSPGLLEPALVGVWRPVLLMPQGIEEHLSAAELEAVIAHELGHLRRRDNLTAAVHMLVEALFWFHPMVWWLGARLVEERERACDESVVEAGADPQTYAQGILKVCRLYLQSPLACAAGVTGSDLRKRVETIMTMRKRLRLSVPKKLLLASAAVAALCGPLAVGLLASGPAIAQPQAAGAADYAPDRIAQRRSEQAEPRKAVPFDPKAFDRFVGDYQFAPSIIFTISRDGSTLLSRLTGQDPVELFPESPTKFFAKVVPAQISFIGGAQGPATELVLHQGGFERHAKRISGAAARTIMATLQHRIEANQPGPGTEAALRKYIQHLETGDDVYWSMGPSLAAISRVQMPAMRGNVKRWGPVKSITFKNVGLQGFDFFIVEFQNAKVQAGIAQLAPDGKFDGLVFRELP